MKYDRVLSQDDTLFISYALPTHHDTINYTLFGLCPMFFGLCTQFSDVNDYY